MITWGWRAWGGGGRRGRNPIVRRWTTERPRSPHDHSRTPSVHRWPRPAQAEAAIHSRTHPCIDGHARLKPKPLSIRARHPCTDGHAPLEPWPLSIRARRERRSSLPTCPHAPSLQASTRQTERLRPPRLTVPPTTLASGAEPPQSNGPPGCHGAPWFPGRQISGAGDRADPESSARARCRSRPDGLRSGGRPR
jgi:hypothetical protein